MNKEINKLIKQIPIIKKKKINQLYMGRTWNSFIHAVNDTQAAKQDLFSCRKIGNVYYIYYGAPKRTMSQTYAKEIYKVMGWYNVMVKPGWTSWKQTTNRFKQKQCWLAVEDGTITKESKVQVKQSKIISLYVLIDGGTILGFFSTQQKAKQKAKKWNVDPGYKIEKWQVDEKDSIDGNAIVIQ